MKVKELIKQLQSYDPNHKVAILIHSDESGEWIAEDEIEVYEDKMGEISKIETLSSFDTRYVKAQNIKDNYPSGKGVIDYVVIADNS